MPRWQAVKIHIVEGMTAGVIIGIVHGLILATAGLYVLVGFGGTLASFARYAGLIGLAGAAVGLVVGFALTLPTRFSKLNYSQPLRPAPLAMIILYVGPWIAFVVQEHFGRVAAACAGVVYMALLVVGLVLSLKRYTPTTSPTVPTGRFILLAILACVLLYGTPVWIARGMQAAEVDGNPLEEFRFEAMSTFAERSATFPARKWNILLLSIDTLRADHLSCYGYGRKTSPAIDALAESGMRFTRAFCQRPKTSPSFASIHTGTYPSRHGVHQTMAELSPQSKTLAEYLAEMGWATGAVITNGNLYPVFGFDQGFESYAYGFDNAQGVTNHAVKWLRSHGTGTEPWFLWVHYTDPHTPYEPLPPYDVIFGNPQDRNEHQRNVDHYDGSIRFTDDQIKRIFDTLNAHRLRERTLIVFVADHGESLGEHNYYYSHGLHPYDPSARIPLIVSAPGVIDGGSSSSVLVGGVDLLPTVLDAAGVDVPEVVQGRSFLPTLLGLSDKSPQSFVFVEAGYHSHDYAGRTLALRRENTKYVHRLTGWARYPDGLGDFVWTMDAFLESGLAPDELYDLVADPGETENLLLQNRALALHERDALLGFAARLAASETLDRDLKPTDLDPATLKSLKSLGYID